MLNKFGGMYTNFFFLVLWKKSKAYCSRYSLLKPRKSRYISGYCKTLDCMLKAFKIALWPSLSFLDGIEWLFLSFSTSGCGGWRAELGSCALQQHLVTGQRCQVLFLGFQSPRSSLPLLSGTVFVPWTAWLVWKPYSWSEEVGYLLTVAEGVVGLKK